MSNIICFLHVCDRFSLEIISNRSTVFCIIVCFFGGETKWEKVHFLFVQKKQAKVYGIGKHTRGYQLLKKSGWLVGGGGG